MIVLRRVEAVLAWLLDEGRDGADIVAMLTNATAVVGSNLTLVGCDRVLARATALDACGRFVGPRKGWT